MGKKKIQEEKKPEVDLKDLKARAADVLAYCRGQVLQKHPFTGSVAMSLDLIPVRDFRCDTALTDGSTIFFDIDFLSRLTQDEREFVIAHEVWHNVMLHFARLESRQPHIFNVASDMEVNQLLQEDGFIPPKDVCFPNGKDQPWNLPSKLSAEEYYELLLKQMPQEKQFGSGGSGSGGEQDDSQGGKKRGKQLSGQFDKHYDKNHDYDRDAEEYEKAMKKIMDKYGEKGVDPDFRPASGKSTSERVEKMREAVISAAQQTERSRGSVPGSIAQIVKDMLEPKVNWREILAKNVTSTVANRTNWNMPNKRFAYSGIYLPRHQGEAVRLAVGIDTSGSCAQDCQKFLTEINAIAKQFGDYELHVIQCDTEIKDATTYDENNLLDPESNGIEFKGFGGTTLHPIFDYIKENELEVDQIVVFTDAECEDFPESDAPDIPTTWVITGGSKGENLRFGDKIHIED